MLLATLLGALERRSLRRGAVTLCIGYGMGITMLSSGWSRGEPGRTGPDTPARGRMAPDGGRH